MPNTEPMITPERLRNLGDLVICNTRNHTELMRAAMQAAAEIERLTREVAVRSRAMGLLLESSLPAESLNAYLQCGVWPAFVQQQCEEAIAMARAEIAAEEADAK